MAVYRSAWFSKWTAQSLERVSNGKSGADSSSWALCDRPTPGGPGNADYWRAETASVEIGPTPFTPNGDGADDLLSIRIKAPPDHRVKIRIFAFNGKLLKTFTDEREVVYWNGITDGGKPAMPGAIYVVTEFTANGTKRVIRKNGVLWR
jgi:gliding motility-associated-like protein